MNQTLADEFSINLKAIFQHLESRIGETNELGTRQHLMGLCGLLVLNFNLYHNPDRKLAKQVWDLHKKIPGVHVAGNLVWFHTDFMLHNLPYMPKVVDKKQQIQAGVFISDRVPQTQAEKEADRRMAMQAKTFREQYLIERSQNIARLSQQFYLQVSAWMIRMESELSSGKDSFKLDINSRSSLFIQGMLLAYCMSSLARTLLSLHSSLNKPMAKSAVQAVCKIIELLKCVQYTYHRRAMLVANYSSLIVNHYELLLLTHLEMASRGIQESRQKGYTERALDILAAQALMKTVLNGPGTRERRLVARLAYHFTLPRQPKEEDKIPGLIRKLEAICELRSRLQEACDCSFLYWHKEVLIPLYLADIYERPTDAHRLHYMFAALRDCVPTLKWCKHQESSEVLLGMFEREVDGYMKERIFAPLCRDIEEDLRLSTHLHLKLDDRNPFKVGLRDLKHFMEVKPIRFFDRSIDIKAHVTHYLDTTFYNLTTVALHDWKSYGDMRNLAEQKYGLVMLEPHLPSATVEQGLDVLEIMRNIHVFVARYCYNLNNQIFVERSSNNKHLNTINIRHIANSIRTHGTGIMNTTVC